MVEAGRLPAGPVFTGSIRWRSTWPPLRERREDIPLLCAQFIQRATPWAAAVPSSRALPAEAQELLNAYDYPGNVRELANAIEYAGIVAADEWIRGRDLPYRFSYGDTGSEPGVSEKLLEGKTLQQLEQMAILSAFRATAASAKPWPRSWASANGGLWNKLKEYDLA